MKTMAMAMMLTVATAAWAKGGALDGKSFPVDSGEKGKPAGKDKEVLTFKDGKMHSSACDAYGFGEGMYAANKSGGVTTFEADTTSKTDGKIHWRGTVRGDVVEGTFVWNKSGQAPIEYWFKSPASK
jgi:hypothetical protein